MKKPELLILVAVWQLINGLFAFLALLTIAMLFAIPWAIPSLFVASGQWTGLVSGPEMAIFVILLVFIMLLLLAYFIMSLAAGIGTIQGKNWARILGIVHAVINIVNFPVGTAIGILIIVYLEKAEVKAYFNGNEATLNSEMA